MAPENPTKMALLAALRASGDEAVATLRALPPESLARVCYAGGWNGREVVAHLAAIEWTYPRLIDLARQATAHQTGQQGAPGDTEAAPSLSGGIDGYNARQVAKRAGIPIDDLIDEFARNRAATIGAVEAIDEPLLAVAIRSAGGIEGPLADVLRWVAVDHVLGHLHDITSGE
ncbi:MAG: DinB family protein [Thermomicrobiales bacterium]